ncbi:MAG: sugar transferase [Micrococcales bacterium]|nr:sugar transferase [Micrococcales bacterium]
MSELMEASAFDRTRARSAGPAPVPTKLVGGPLAVRPVHSPTPGWATRYRWEAAAGDIAAVLVAMAIAILIRFRDGMPDLQVLWAMPVLPVMWVLTLSLAGAYSPRFIGLGSDEFVRVGRAAASMFAVISAVAFVLNYEISRVFVLVALPLSLLGSLVFRRLLRGRLARARVAGRSLQPAIVVGHGQQATHLVRDLGGAPADTGFSVVGVCGSGLPAAVETERGQVPVLGAASDVVRLVRSTGAEVVVVCSDADLAGHALRRLSWALAKEGAELFIAPGIADVAAPRVAVRPLGSFSLLHVERPIVGGAKLVMSRAMDLLLGGMITFAALPILATVAMLVKLEDGGPIFFRQKRVGVDGHEFEMLKFRSMVVDAEARLKELESTQSNVVLFKHKQDPRITRIGRFTRRYSLDELPQLFNVLRGEMSLVGPRPPLPREVDQYEPDAIERMRVRPGMTGLWQVSGRSDLTWEESLRLDLWYVDNWSPMLDIQILARTFSAVVAGRGAY